MANLQLYLDILPLIYRRAKDILVLRPHELSSVAQLERYLLQDLAGPVIDNMEFGIV